mmetsp:Transcript_12293/g.25005  ORF Transcript_12293/g.25005 Transcript_12293/m.25005 type:complete len:141 (+) Transcript_12293:122-544(+)
MEPDDNPFRRPAGQATSTPTANPGAAPIPAVAADAVDGTGQRQCGCMRLAEANATAQRTVGVGADVLASLETQRAQLISTQGTLSQQQSDLNRAGALVSQMMRRALTNKLVLRVIALTLLALIILILIAKYAPRSSQNNN